MIQLKALVEEVVQLGFLGKPFALRGECTFHPFHSVESQLKPPMEIYLQKAGTTTWLKLQLSSIKWKHDSAIVSFTEIQSIDQAKELTQSGLFVERKNFALLGNDQYYLHDLLNFEVIDQQSGASIGVIARYSFNHAGQTVMEVDSKGKNLDILFFPFVKKVDLKTRRCYIDMPEYE